MSIFQQLGQQQSPRPAQLDYSQMMRQLQADPVGFLRKAGLNVPEGMTDPRQIVSYFRQANPRLYHRAMQMMQSHK